MLKFSLVSKNFVFFSIFLLAIKIVTSSNVTFKFSEKSLVEIRENLLKNFYESNLKSSSFDEYRNKLNDFQKKLVTWRNSECMQETHKRIDSSLVEFTKSNTRIWEETLTKWKNYSSSNVNQFVFEVVKNIENMVKY